MLRVLGGTCPASIDIMLPFTIGWHSLRTVLGRTISRPRHQNLINAAFFGSVVFHSNRHPHLPTYLAMSANINSTTEVKWKSRAIIAILAAGSTRRFGKSLEAVYSPVPERFQRTRILDSSINPRGRVWGYSTRLHKSRSDI